MDSDARVMRGSGGRSYCRDDEGTRFGSRQYSRELRRQYHHRKRNEAVRRLHEVIREVEAEGNDYSDGFRIYAIREFVREYKKKVETGPFLSGLRKWVRERCVRPDANLVWRLKEEVFVNAGREGMNDMLQILHIIGARVQREELGTGTVLLHSRGSPSMRRLHLLHILSIIPSTRYLPSGYFSSSASGPAVHGSGKAGTSSRDSGGAGLIAKLGASFKNAASTAMRYITSIV
mmetsp:Transcript_24341/g.58761  ORF Transcript_24341/g.58761 Transcript_24341/m.58761 type:complete len:233 (-) Transcript_24341:164-862(-)